MNGKKDMFYSNAVRFKLKEEKQKYKSYEIGMTLKTKWYAFAKYTFILVLDDEGWKSNIPIPELFNVLTSYNLNDAPSIKLSPCMPWSETKHEIKLENLKNPKYLVLVLDKWAGLEKQTSELLKTLIDNQLLSNAISNIFLSLFSSFFRCN